MQFFSNLALVALAILPLGALSAVVPAHAKAGDAIPDSYIVVLKDSISKEAFSTHQAWAKDLHSAAARKRDTAAKLSGFEHSYNFGKLRGYSGSFDKQTIQEIASRTDVAFVEPDKVVTAAALTTQASVTWGLSRISHKSTGAGNYIYDNTAGSGVTAYTIDTGILTTHNEFEGRATWGYNAVSGSSNTDRNGHGTHVSGTIAGKTYGIAKKASLVAVKVLGDNGSGTTSGVIAGIQWAATNSKGKKAVANMSLGGGYSASLNSAVESAISGGLTFVVAAGNDNTNAANYSPASAPNAITVGATTSSDARSSFSNYGSSLDVFAPGSSIVSSYIGSNSQTNTLSGTSMASPHVAGVAAYLLGLESLSSPAAVRSRIIALAQSGKVTSPGSGSPNLLLYNGSGA